ncbi:MULTISPECIES: NFACT family protein [Anaerococcus]|uniref:Rqc2 family fibronectin-binding protein n=1 Tax=Anaerococcus TaxID=165779 RepID=UPI0002EA8FF8|nr:MULTISPECIES: NFACT RNA binding domain-containing protein [Anaerococcus]MDU0946299.1 NFACT RNA binding domain-containing protein [Anaerococcus vaginalis]MDU1030460.1 NFACT RNA binding domain-containing protein [Anaerococcus vaginalis]
MSYDGLVTKAITFEIKKLLLGGKIQKISQPSKNDIVLNIYSIGKSYKLLLSANNNEARVHITERKYENPISPPNFCMVLRKYLNQSKIVEIEQYKMDRVIIFHISSVDEMGFDISNKLIVEIMGKYSNIILTDENYKIIDSIKRVNFKMSSVREILPGLEYKFIESNKINILESDFSLDILKLDKNIADNQNPEKLLYENYLGFSPTISKELIYKSNIDPRINWGLVSEDEKQLLNDNLYELRNSLINNTYSPVLYKNSRKYKEFYSFDLSGLGFEKILCNSMSNAIENFYESNKSNDRLRQIKNNLLRKINSQIKLVNKKIDILNKNLSKEKNMDSIRMKGDLLAANVNKLNKGYKEIILKDFYNNNKDIKISLDSRKNPWENVDSYYKRYKKIKNSIDFAKDDLPKQNDLLEYLNQVSDFVERSESISDLDEIKEELIENKIIKNTSRNKKKTKSKSKPMQFKTVDNSNIYVGKNSRQNDYITLKLANKNDYFFHVRNAPGSHVILKTNLLNENDIKIASYLAASNSSQAKSNKVDVDYTEKKNVNKAKGAKPGMVYYENFKTVTVNMDENPKNLYEKIK